MIDTINTICKDIAPTLGLDEALVKKVYANYWKNVKLSIASGKHTSIWIRSIGTLAVSRTKVNKAIRKYILRIRQLRADRTALHTRKSKEQMMVELLSALNLLCARRNELAIAYNDNLKRIATKTQGRVGQQILDSPGSGEQVLQPSQGVS